MSDSIEFDNTNDEDPNSLALNEAHTGEQLSNNERMRLFTERRRRMEDIQESRRLSDEFGLFDEALSY